MAIKSLFEVSHKLWVDAQLRAPDWAKEKIISNLHEAKDLIWLRPYLTVHRLNGYYQGQSLTVDYVGLNHKPTLTTALFDEEPPAQAHQQILLWQLNNLAESSDSDLTVVAGSKYLVSKLPRQAAIILPFHVSMTLNVEGSWEDVRSRLSKSVRKNELRLMRKYGYEYELSDRDEDFELFYHHMYVPTVNMRKGELAAPMSIREAYQYFRHERLLQLIKRDGRYIAGSLSHTEGDLVKFRLMGIRDADEQLLHEGALAACYYSIVHWANENGYGRVAYGECVPV